MNKLVKMLPALGLVLGAGMALAMNVPTMVTDKVDPKVWTPDSDPMHAATNGYREITDENLGTDYLCNTTSQVCRVEFENDDPYGEISELTPGIYVPQ
ncbi:DUF6520 family protein [Algoriphagus winogradskyi]|nr:DUF6520 family protein [Algoriphagus winogradskyi]